MAQEMGEGTPPQELHPLLPKINRQDVHQIAADLSYAFEDTELTSAKTPQLDQQEQDYLKSRVKADQKGRLDLKGHNKIDLQDRDKLWVALNILYSKDQAETAYLIVRSAQLWSLGATVDPSKLSAEKLHQEMLKRTADDPRVWRYLNSRQIIFGENAALKLLDQQLNPGGATGTDLLPQTSPAVQAEAQAPTMLQSQEIIKLYHQNPYQLLKLMAEGNLTAEQILSLPNDPEALQKNRAVPTGRFQYTDISHLLVQGSKDLIANWSVSKDDLPRMGIASLRGAYLVLENVVSRYSDGSITGNMTAGPIGLSIDQLGRRARQLSDDVESDRPILLNFQKGVSALVAVRERLNPQARQARVNQQKQQLKQSLSHAVESINLAKKELEAYETINDEENQQNEARARSRLEVQQRTSELVRLTREDPAELIERIREGYLTVNEVCGLPVDQGANAFKNFIAEATRKFFHPDSDLKKRNFEAEKVVFDILMSLSKSGVDETTVRDRLARASLAALVDSYKFIRERFPQRAGQMLKRDDSEELLKTLMTSDGQAVGAWQNYLLSGKLYDFYLNLENEYIYLTDKVPFKLLKEDERITPAVYQEWFDTWIEERRVKEDSGNYTNQELHKMYANQPYALSRLLWEGLLTEPQIRSLADRYFWHPFSGEENYTAFSSITRQVEESLATNPNQSVEEVFNGWLEQQKDKYPNERVLDQHLARVAVIGLLEGMWMMSNLRVPVKEGQVLGIDFAKKILQDPLEGAICRYNKNLSHIEIESKLELARLCLSRFERQQAA